MEKIDLNTRVADWISKPVPSTGLCVAVLHSSGRDLTIRDFLKMDKGQLSQYKYIGAVKIREFQRMLSYYGLKMGMTDEELAEYEGQPVPQEAPSDGIDWEQRKWDLAVAFILRHPDLKDADAVELAENFIENYKHPFKTEEIV